MKKLLLGLLVCGFLWSACSNDFEVSASWKEVPVVYAILSVKDTANYIRVEKAFLDPDKSALEIAQIADSIYYPANAITVYLEHVKTKNRVKLTRVDGNLEGHPRKDGIFATTPNWLYKLKAQSGSGLIAGDKYKLVIVRADGSKDITSLTTMPNDFIFLTPFPNGSPTQMSFQAAKSTSIQWQGDTSSTFFDVSMRIRYRVVNGNGAVLAHRIFTWDVAKNVLKGTAVINTNQGPFYTSQLDVSGDAFFEKIAAQVKADDLAGIDTISNDRFRYFEGVDIVLSGGGSEIYQYLQTASANAGITGSEIIGTYTNLSEGYGIFTGKNTVSLGNIKITEITINSMNASPITKPLNFQYF